MRKLRVFLTGSSGFIGKNIYEKLKDKYNFAAPAHKDLNLMDTLAVNNYFKKWGSFDIILDCAVVGGRRSTTNNFQTAYDNLRIFFNLASCDKYFSKYIHFGSGAEFAMNTSVKLVKETQLGEKVPSDPFGFSKYVIAKYIEDNNKFINLRLFGVYGKYEKLNTGFVSNSICKAIYNMPIIINQNVYYEYINVLDLIPIVSYFIENKSKYRSYNVGHGKPIDILSIANIINNISTRKTKIIIINKGFNHEYSANLSRLKREFKFELKNHVQSIGELYLWYKKRKHLIDKQALS